VAGGALLLVTESVGLLCRLSVVDRWIGVFAVVLLLIGLSAGGRQAARVFDSSEDAGKGLTL
jgi:hypothetical protein